VAHRLAAGHLEGRCRCDHLLLRLKGDSIGRLGRGGPLEDIKDTLKLRDQLRLGELLPVNVQRERGWQLGLRACQELLKVCF
jgi:hypothetical protein